MAAPNNMTQKVIVKCNKYADKLSIQNIGRKWGKIIGIMGPMLFRCNALSIKPKRRLWEISSKFQCSPACELTHITALNLPRAFPLSASHPLGTAQIPRPKFPSYRIWSETLSTNRRPLKCACSEWSSIRSRLMKILEGTRW